jgi:hypothetical protein
MHRMATSSEIKDAIAEQAKDGIRRVTGDSGSTEMHNPSDLVGAARFSVATDAVMNRQRAGIRIMKFQPGGAGG